MLVAAMVLAVLAAFVLVALIVLRDTFLLLILFPLVVAGIVALLLDAVIKHRRDQPAGGAHEHHGEAPRAGEMDRTDEADDSTGDDWL